VAHFGVHITDREYEVERQLVRELISLENGKRHLKKYLEEWDRPAPKQIGPGLILPSSGMFGS
jgi:hypothetical protein